MPKYTITDQETGQWIKKGLLPFWPFGRWLWVPQKGDDKQNTAC
jgi:hypothetical protein